MAKRPGAHSNYRPFDSAALAKTLEIINAHGHDVVPEKVGREVFGGGYSRASLKSRGLAAKSQLAEILRQRVNELQAPSPEKIARIKPMEGGPRVGENLAGRIHRLKQVGNLDLLFDRNVPTPPTPEEVEKAMNTYIDRMSRAMGKVPKHRWMRTGARKISDLSSSDMEKPHKWYAQALYWTHKGNVGKESAEKRFVKGLLAGGREAERALEGIGVRAKDRPAIMDELRGIRGIPRYMKAVARSRGVSIKEARRIMLESLSGRSREYLKGWGDKKRRLEIADSLMEKTGGAPLRIPTESLPKNLLRWYERRGIKGRSSALAALLEEAGHIKPWQKRILEEGRAKVFTRQRDMLRRASEDVPQTWHGEFLSRKELSKPFKQLKREVESALATVEEGKTSLTDVATYFGIGVRGAQRLQRQFRERGGVRLWGRNSGPRRMPPVRRDMLSAPDILDELRGHYRLLSGASSREKNPVPGARVSRSGALDVVHGRMGSLLEHAGEGRPPPLNKIRLLRAGIDSVEPGDNKVVVSTGRRRERKRRIRDMDMGSIRRLCAELEREALEHKRNA